LPMNSSSVAHTCSLALPSFSSENWRRRVSTSKQVYLPSVPLMIGSTPESR
jgi:hypothetical protein